MEKRERRNKGIHMTTWTNIIALLARILLAILFVQGGYGKLFGGTAGTVANMTSHGIPVSQHPGLGRGRGRARHWIVPDGRPVRALGGADLGGLYWRWGSSSTPIGWRRRPRRASSASSSSITSRSSAACSPSWHSALAATALTRSSPAANRVAERSAVGNRSGGRARRIGRLPCTGRSRFCSMAYC
jgi:hypothetical protein